MTKFTSPHAWDVTVEEAIEIQEELRHQVIKSDQLGTVRYVAGVDADFINRGSITRAAVAVLSYPELELCDQAVVRRPTNFPYMPGLLSFREIPALLDALEQLTILPDLLLCDGQGLAHPRRFGLGCHLGLITNIPTIGVAKKRFIGQHEPVPAQRGSWQPLRHQEEIIGAALRSRTNVNPLYVSIGHRISLETAIKYALACAPNYRLPETTRIADQIARGRG